MSGYRMLPMAAKQLRSSDRAAFDVYVFLLLETSEESRVTPDGLTLDPGDVLFSDAKLAEQLGRSRNLVKRAIRVLVDEGLIWVMRRPRKPSVFSVFAAAPGPELTLSDYEEEEEEEEYAASGLEIESIFNVWGRAAYPSKWGPS